MAPIAIVFGVLLALLSGGLFAVAEHFSPTIFIPAGFGVVLIVLGLVARNDKFRMHAMHGAALIGLIGFVMPLGRVVYASTKPDFHFGWAAGGSVAMALLCAAFLGLCVKSFIDVRKARKQKETDGHPAPPIA